MTETQATPVNDPFGYWAFSFAYLPPGNNHMYMPIGKQGQKALTEEARELRAAIANEAFLAGFRPRLTAAYSVRVVFTMPGWGGDIDGPLKALLDSVFGARADHRVVHLDITKEVQSGVRRTAVEIEEVAVPSAIRLSPVRSTSHRSAGQVQR